MSGCTKKMGISVLAVIFLSIVTKIFGFVKQIIIAGAFGASSETDVFYLAFGLLTSLTYAIFSALSVTFVPFYQRLNNEKKDADLFVKNTIFIFLTGTLILTGLLLCLTPYAAKILVSSKSSLSVKEVSIYIRLLSPLLALGCMNTIYGAVMEANKVFVYSKSSGILTSICVILFIFLFQKILGVKCLVYGTIAGYVLQLLILYVATRRYLKRTQSSFKVDGNIMSLVKLILPLLVGNGIYEINKTIDKILTTSFSAGSTSALAYGQSLFDSLCALTITSTVAVLFTYASDQVVKEDIVGVEKNINESISMLLLITTPIAIILMLNGQNVVSILYGHGAFSTNAIKTTDLILKGYAIGFPFLTFREVFAKVHYAFQDSKTPMKNSMIAVIINICCSIILSKMIGIQGITIATSISYCICSILMVNTIKNHMNYRFWSNKVFYIKLACAGVGMIIVDLMLKYFLPNTMAGIMAICLISGIWYLMILFALKCKEITGFGNIFRR